MSLRLVRLPRLSVSPVRLTQSLGHDPPNYALQHFAVCNIIVEGEAVPCYGLSAVELVLLAAGDNRPGFSSMLPPTIAADTRPKLAALESDDAMVELSRTYRPHFKKRKRKHGFLRRLKSVAGRRIIARRRKKGKKDYAA